jgi:LysM repeat protein
MNMRYAKRIIPLLLLLSLLIAPVASAAPLKSGGYWYQVKWGDTLSTIGWATGVSPWSIASANGLWNPNYIWIGQWLWIPQTYTPPPPPNPGCGYWRPVYGGETLYSIAWQTGHSAWAIAQANGLPNWNLIYAGMSLFIPCY